MIESPAMFQSGQKISRGSTSQLLQELEQFLAQKHKVYCRYLRRPVFLTKLPNAISKRRDARRRLQAFRVALDITQHAYTGKVMKIDGDICHELRGKDAEGKTVIVHLREEKVNSDQKVFFVSCF